MKKFRIAVGADHAGFPSKEIVIRSLSAQGHSVLDCGTDSPESTDYPDYATRVAQAILRGECDRGILACGTGIGMSIAANKFPGIRAAVCWTPAVAQLAAEHNWANVLCLPSRFVKQKALWAIVQMWLRTPNDKSVRHRRRLQKLAKIEAQENTVSFRSC